jgi:type I restriction enzyme S subunit
MQARPPTPGLRLQTEIVHRLENGFAWIDRLAPEARHARKLIDHLDQAVLAKAFRGELVPQDPTDEPASKLLERIRAERSSSSCSEKNRWNMRGDHRMPIGLFPLGCRH